MINFFLGLASCFYCFFESLNNGVTGPFLRPALLQTDSFSVIRDRSGTLACIPGALVSTVAVRVNGSFRYYGLSLSVVTAPEWLVFGHIFILLTKLFSRDQVSSSAVFLDTATAHASLDHMQLPYLSKHSGRVTMAESDVWWCWLLSLSATHCSRKHQLGYVAYKLYGMPAAKYLSTQAEYNRFFRSASTNMS